MDRSIVFVKSAKGQNAIKTNSREISMNDRHILIMVDGKRTVDNLIKEAAVFHEIEATIERLYQSGYIVPFGSPESAPVASPSSQGAAARGALPKEVKAIIEGELVEFLGPIASLLCEEALEKAGSVDEALSALASQLDAQQAKQFKQKVMDRLARS
jgi:hypothetical protein